MNERDDEFTLKGTEIQRNTNLIENNNIHKNITSIKRPEHCITERYIENQCETRRRKIVPGNCSYTSTTDYGENVWDSHTERINRKRFSNLFEKAKFFIKSFPGAKIQNLEHYVVPYLNAQNPNLSVIHIGGNNIIFKSINDIIVKRIAEDIINIGKKCASFGSDVFTSSNDEIGTSFLFDDGVHLSDNGMAILAGNFVNNINSAISKRIFNSGNLNWQETVYNEQKANVGAPSVQSNDCQSFEQILLTSYDIDMVMKTRKTYQKTPITGHLNINSLGTIH